MDFLTFNDALDSLIAYMGSAQSDQIVRDCRQSIDEALRELVNDHNWSYYYTLGRIQTFAPYLTGTIQYQASAGPQPYYVELTGGTWPSWAADAYLRLNNLICRVDQVIDSTHLTLRLPLVPSADLPAGSTYLLYQDTYQLPADFIAQDQALYENCFGAMQYIHPREWLFQRRYLYNTGRPQFYTITSDPKYMNRMVVRLAPIPNDGRTFDFLYKRRPRPIVWTSMSQGTLALNLGSTGVAGNGTLFDQTMVGSILRVSASSALPTWMPGKNPAVFESVIASVLSGNSLTLLSPSTVTYSTASYIISDPIDLETGSMANAFLRCTEHKMSQHRIMKDKPSAKLQYLDELRRAREADSRSFAGRAEGDVGVYRQRLKDMPLGPDAN